MLHIPAQIRLWTTKLSFTDISCRSWHSSRLRVKSEATNLNEVLTAHNASTCSQNKRKKKHPVLLDCKFNWKEKRRRKDLAQRDQELFTCTALKYQWSVKLNLVWRAITLKQLPYFICSECPICLHHDLIPKTKTKQKGGRGELIVILKKQAQFTKILPNGNNSMRTAAYMSS